MKNLILLLFVSFAFFNTILAQSIIKLHKTNKISIIGNNTFFF